MYDGHQQLDLAILQIITSVVVLTLHACIFSCGRLTLFAWILVKSRFLFCNKRVVERF